MSLIVYNTLTGKKEEFAPLHGKTVNMYVCGVTPYDEVHLGHARCYVAFDVIRRYLEFRGYTVNYVQNFTDIDDKIINRAKEKNVDPLELSGKYIEEYFKDIDALNIKHAKIYPKVTEHVPEIVNMVETLVKQDKAYVVDGDVYFRVSRFAGYGKLSKRDLHQLKSGARVEVDERKEDPLDFALWKKGKTTEPSWASPWGNGRPGWHIECSAMSLKELRTETLDIHGGGQDLIFPHHENEVAQSEAATGKPFAKYWLHNGFVIINKEKMSKSLGNFFTLKEIYKKYEPQVVRLFLLSQHYRHPVDYSDDKLVEATKGLDKFYAVLKNVEDLVEHASFEIESKLSAAPPVIIEIETKFTLAMDDDFNTAGALAVLYEIVSMINKELETEKTDVLKISFLAKTLVKLGKVLGLFGVLKSLTKNEDLLKERNITEKEIEKLIELRNEYRRNKRWEDADKVRLELLAKNIILEDTAHGTRWKIKSFISEAKK